jgi:hypothetical protein
LATSFWSVNGFISHVPGATEEVLKAAFEAETAPGAVEKVVIDPRKVNVGHRCDVDTH